MAAPLRFFFVGTLRPGAPGQPGTDNPMMRTLTAAARHVGGGRVRGRLHRLGWYPGMVESRGGWVRGDLLELHDPAWLARLDVYENVSDPPSPADEYVRRRKRVSLDDGQRVMAWVYLYNRPPGDAPVIESGDFLA